MNRKQVIEFCRREIYPQVKIWIGIGGELTNVVELVSSWRRTHAYPQEMRADVRDGFLFINGDPVGRIAPKTPRVKYSAKAAYWEGRILERQGT